MYHTNKIKKQVLFPLLISTKIYINSLIQTLDITFATQQTADPVLNPLQTVNHSI